MAVMMKETMKKSLKLEYSRDQVSCRGFEIAQET